MIHREWTEGEVLSTSKREDRKRAIKKVVNREYPEGIRNSKQRLRLVSENGCQPTSLKFMEHMAILRIEQRNNPKGKYQEKAVYKNYEERFVLDKRV